MRACGRRCAAAAALLLSARGAAAQDPWGAAWTPLAPIADIARGLLAAPNAAGLLTRPPDAIGLFWTGGNPGALPFEISPSFSIYGVGFEDQAGGYRRPLDPGAVSTGAAAATGWGPLGGRGGAVGRASFWDETREPDALSHQVRPYGSSPLMASDSSAPAVDRVRVRFEGAGGWRLGAWGLGAALGYEALDNRTQSTRLPRIGRLAAPGATVGVVRAFGTGAWRLGLAWRFQQSVETFQVTARGGANSAGFLLHGFSEPFRQPINSMQPLVRRFEREASAWTPSVAGTVFGIAWTAVLSSERMRDEQRASTVNRNVGVDRWLAEGWSWTVAVQRPFRVLGWSALATAGAGRRSLDGDVTVSTIQGIVVTQRETDLRLNADLRATSRDTTWQAALGFTTRHVTREWDDYLAQLSANLDSWTPGICLEIARRFTPQADVSLAFGWAGQYGSARLPNPANEGPGYQFLVAPQLSLEATQAAAVAWNATVRHRLGGASALWFRLRYENAGPQGDSLPYGPSSDARRKIVTYQLGLTAGL